MKTVELSSISQQKQDLTSAHLLFPYQWEDCSDELMCKEFVHVKDKASSLNAYPLEWVKSLIGCDFLDTERIEWRNGKGQLHRVDGPADVTVMGARWWFEDLQHRDDAPAAVNADGSLEWWMWGIKHWVTKKS